MELKKEKTINITSNLSAYNSYMNCIKKGDCIALEKVNANELDIHITVLNDIEKLLKTKKRTYLNVHFVIDGKGWAYPLAITPEQKEYSIIKVQNSFWKQPEEKVNLCDYITFDSPTIGLQFSVKCFY